MVDKQVVTLGLTTDAWTNELTSMQYITVTIHFLDRNWKMNSLILATREADERHTADNVRKFIRKILDEYGAYGSGIIYVTDNAANMKAAFKDEVWMGCSGHNLNLVLSHALQHSKKAEENEVPEEVTDLISTCKELVTLAKRTKINQQLEKTLKQCVITRWNSVLTTLKSVEENLPDLRQIASEKDANRNLLRLLCDINEEFLIQVIHLLKPFEEATKVLSADKVPSLHLVLPSKYRLQCHLSLLGTDSTLIIQMKKHLLAQLERYFHVSDMHAAATLLDPRLENNTSLISA